MDRFSGRRHPTRGRGRLSKGSQRTPSIHLLPVGHCTLGSSPAGRLPSRPGRPAQRRQIQSPQLPLGNRSRDCQLHSRHHPGHRGGNDHPLRLSHTTDRYRGSSHLQRSRGTRRYPTDPFRHGLCRSRPCPDRSIPKGRPLLFRVGSLRKQGSPCFNQIRSPLRLPRRWMARLLQKRRWHGKTPSTHSQTTGRGLLCTRIG